MIVTATSGGRRRRGTALWPSNKENSIFTYGAFGADEGACYVAHTQYDECDDQGYLSEEGYETYQIRDCDKIYPSLLTYAGLAFPACFCCLCCWFCVRIGQYIKKQLPFTEELHHDDADYYKNKYNTEKQQNEKRFKTYRQWEEQVYQRQKTIESISNATKQRQMDQ